MADLFLVDNNLDNLGIADGQVVLQLSTGQAWIKLNNVLVPFTGGFPEVSDFVFSVFIDGVLKNDLIDIKNFSISDTINERTNTCTFRYRNNADTNNNISEGQVVAIFDKDNNKIFGGEIIKLTKKEEYPSGDYIIYQVQCLSWEKRLDAKRVANVYLNKTCKEIIDDIITNFAPEFTTFNVQEGLLLEKITFNYKTVGQAIRTLAKITSFNWYVDYNKDIHFFSDAGISDLITIDATSDFKNFSFIVDKSQLRNQITLRGGFFEEFFGSDIQVADGEKTTFRTAYAPFSPIEAFIDTGGGFVQKTVGIKNVDTTGKDFVVDFTEKTLENLDLAKLNSGDILKITYNRQVPVIAFGQDDDSIARLAAIENNDGIYEYTIVDDSIESISTGNDRISAELADNANPKITGGFKTCTTGWKSGQVVNINLVNFGLENQQFLIQRVKIVPKTNVNVDGRSYIEYTINFMTYLKGLQEFLLQLFDKQNTLKIDENEIIHTFFQFTDAMFTNVDDVTFQKFGTIFKYDAADAKYDAAVWS